MTIRAALFDLDGTLVDSLEDLTDAVNHIRNAYSHQLLTSDEVRAMVGKGARHLVQQVLPDVGGTELDRALAMFLTFNGEHIADKSRLYPGTAELLRELADRDIMTAVISNKNEDMSRLILQALGVYDRFSVICGGDTYPERKPSPLPLLKVMEQLGAERSECIMIGDSINDIEAGRQAGIKTAACAWGYGGSEELDGADYRIATLQELRSVLTAELPGSCP